MTKPPFKDVNEAIEWLSEHDNPTDCEYDCNIKHRIRFNDDNWFEFSSDNDLKEWIEYDYYQMKNFSVFDKKNPEEESK